MSALGGPGAFMLDKGGIPPKEQRILAPSTVDVEHNGGYSTQCVCTLRVTDVVNLAVYYVPLTPGMVTQLRTALAQHDSTAQPTTTEQDY